MATNDNCISRMRTQLVDLLGAHELRLRGNSRLCWAVHFNTGEGNMYETVALMIYMKLVCPCRRFPSHSIARVDGKSTVESWTCANRWCNDYKEAQWQDVTTSTCLHAGMVQSEARLLQLDPKDEASFTADILIQLLDQDAYDIEGRTGQTRSIQEPAAS
ncbi:hypothetical protein BDB00DRAFT_927838 [Zychaea mexicana]|uniref:uncharacterized protein n=1 Tax=Zychaea mexicana TaxID=64656 RepID=UPI0022FEFC6B|nr:uncharacterized protein BDB00DRAFT_927838 [Zychaea mexicana]KAI9494893.1 hypothetical protein BDB00DRAFT_927838 [Zychaea mexicana]